VIGDVAAVFLHRASFTWLKMKWLSCVRTIFCKRSVCWKLSAVY